MSGVHRNRVISAQRIVQLVAAAAFNGYALGFQKGKIFTGGTKAVCVPVLNCYSCPGALGACPIGALQTALGGVKSHFPFYVLGLLINRRNIASGTTTVHDLDKRALGSFTLTDPLDAALVDDARCYHGVTPVEPENPALPAYRDVLVVTFKKKQ